MVNESTGDMKRLSYILFALFGMACAKENINTIEYFNSVDVPEGKVKLSITVSRDPATKASMEAKQLSFEVGDKIAVIGTLNEETSVVTLDVEEISTFSVTFSTAIDEDMVIGEYAYYPASIVDKDAPTRIVWPSSFNGTKTQVPMMAKIDVTNNSAVFRYLGAMLKVNLKDAPETVNAIEFKTSNNFVGKYNVTFSGDEVTAVSKVDATMTTNSETISVALTSDDPMADPQLTYYIPIPAGTYAEFQLAMKEDNYYHKQRTSDLRDGEDAPTTISPSLGSIVYLGDFEYDVDHIDEWYINGYSTGWNKNKDTRYIKIGADSYQLVAYAQQDGYRIYDGSLQEWVEKTNGNWSGELKKYDNDDDVIPFTENKLFYAKIYKSSSVWNFDNTTRIEGWDWCWSSSKTVKFVSSITVSESDWTHNVILSKYNYNNNFCWSGSITIPDNKEYEGKFMTWEGEGHSEWWHGKNGLSITDSKPYGTVESTNSGDPVKFQLTPGEYIIYLDLHDFNFMFVKQPKPVAAE